MAERKFIPVKIDPNRDPTCTVVGSFKNKPLIDQTIDTLEANQIKVLAPPKGAVTQIVGDIKVLEGDDLTSEHGVELENRFIHLMTSSDVIYVVNPTGYVGAQATWELGVASASGIPIYGMRRVIQVADDDPTEALYGKLVYASVVPKPLDEFVEMVKSGKLDITDCLNAIHPKKRTAPLTQGYVRLPIKRPLGMSLDWFKEILVENQIPQRLVDPQDWPEDF